MRCIHLFSHRAVDDLVLSISPHPTGLSCLPAPSYLQKGLWKEQLFCQGFSRTLRTEWEWLGSKGLGPLPGLASFPWRGGGGGGGENRAAVPSQVGPLLTQPGCTCLVVHGQGAPTVCAYAVQVSSANGQDVSLAVAGPLVCSLKTKGLPVLLCRQARASLVAVATQAPSRGQACGHGMHQVCKAQVSVCPQL